MKRTMHIHLGGMPFVIEEEAFELLNQYLTKLKSKFTNPHEQKEIIEDIESRMAEVFAKKLDKNNLVISSVDAASVIAQLGHPEEIEDQPTSSSTQTEKEFVPTKDKVFARAGEKKLFRDGDSKVVGGVISGLCQYFGWKEPLWARIVFVLLLWFSFGTAVLVYIILWLLVPEAKSYADKLQMKGEPVTLDTIEKEVKAAMNRTEALYNDTTAKSTVDKLWAVVKLIIAGAMKIGAFFGFILSILLLIVFAMFSLGISAFGLSAFSDYTQLFFDSRSNYISMAVLVGLAIGIPLFWIMYSSASYLFSSKVNVNRNLGVALFVGWIVALLSGIYLISTYASNFKTPLSEKTDTVLVQPSTNRLEVLSFTDSTQETIKIISPKGEYEWHSDINTAGFGKTENGFMVGRAAIEILPSADSLYHLSQLVSVKGKNNQDAKKQLRLINTRFVQKDSLLMISSYVEIFKNGRWRHQQQRNRIYLPEGKELKIAADYFDTNLSDLLENGYNEQGKTIIKCVDGKIVCINCTGQKEETKDEE